jgi:hypothetical protein
MKIHKWGQVILEKGKPIRVEGWNIERTPDDPPESEITYEQLLLGHAVNWALTCLKEAITSNLFDAWRKIARKQRIN